MTNAIDKAKQYIKEENYNEAFKLAKKRHGRDDIESYLAILDLLIETDYITALEEKGIYYQFYDETHDNGDYGEKYFDEYLNKQPKSINVLCDKAMSLANKNKIDKALEYMDTAYVKYDTYSEVEKPRISKKEVRMGKIELLIKAKEFEKALKLLNKFEEEYGGNPKVDLYKGQMLQKEGQNKEALEYLEKSLKQEHTLIGYNAQGDAFYELKQYSEALKSYKTCIKFEKEAKNDLELITNFNYKAGFCCVELKKDQEAIKYFNKIINILNEHGRLPNDLENIYQKCSFEKERIMKKGEVEDKEFSKSRFLPLRYSIGVLIIIIIIYFILKMNGY